MIGRWLLTALRSLTRIAGRAPAPQPSMVAVPVDGDLADFAFCPGQQRRTAHAMRADGSRRCWDCGLITHGRTR